MAREVQKGKNPMKLARSIGSGVAVAAFQRSGAGKDGGSVRAQNRRARKSVRRVLHRIDF